MIAAENLNRIYEELTARYNPISTSTIKSVLKGKLKVKSGKVTFGTDTDSTPSMGEAEDAFKKYNCAIFTAFRGGYTLAENLERNARLKADMEARGLSFRPVDGCYREADWEYTCKEYCFFVYDVDGRQSRQFFEKIYSLSAKYDQDSFLYKRAGINRTAFLVATTEAGRKDLHGNIKFAGELYTDVHDVVAWTACSDGKIAFQLKGMILIGTSNKKIKIGEGNIFDIKGYDPDGIVVIRDNKHNDLKEACHNYKGNMPLVERYFMKENQTEAEVHEKIIRALKVLKDKKCKRIGFHCSASINGSYLEGAKVAYETIQQWAKRNDKFLSLIVVVDIYGDYSKVLNDK